MLRLFGGIIVGLVGFIALFILAYIVLGQIFPEWLTRERVTDVFTVGLVPGALATFFGLAGAFMGTRMFLRYYDMRKREGIS